MTYTFFKWFQDFAQKGGVAFNWLISKPFSNIEGIPNDIQNITPLALVGLGGLLVFIIVAVVKWVIS